MLAGISVGCQTPAPPPQRVNVPLDPSQGPVTTYEPMRPMRSERDPGGQVPAPLYDDVPLIAQAPPEQQAFTKAYAAVGKPRIVVFVNRGFDGAILPVTEQRPLIGVDVRREATAAVDVERRSTAQASGRFNDTTQTDSDSFRSTGPASYREVTEVYLAPGQYDEVQAGRIDYEAIENVLTDWFSAGGKVTLISADMARQRLTEEQLKELQSGRPTSLREIAARLDADVIIQAQAKPTRQTEAGLEVRVLVEAINVPRGTTAVGGESLARAFVDVPPPLEKTQINKYTRYLARKIMSQITQSWEAK